MLVRHSEAWNGVGMRDTLFNSFYALNISLTSIHLCNQTSFAETRNIKKIILLGTKRRRFLEKKLSLEQDFFGGSCLNVFACVMPILLTGNLYLSLVKVNQFTCEKSFENRKF